MKTPILVLIAALAVLPALAAPAPDLFTATVPVADQSEAERRRALRRGLADVVVKLTGDSAQAQSAAALELIEQAGDYAVEYGYTDRPAGDGVALTVRFAEGDVERFLRRSQLPLWPANRPRLLVWMVSDDPQEGRSFIGRENNPEAYRALSAAFERRGVPLLFPLLDLEDQMNLSPADAWRFNTEALARAAERYQADAWLVVRYYETSDGRWRGAWLLGGDGDPALDDARGDELDELIASSVDGAVDELATGFTYVPRGMAEAVQLEVRGIETFDSYRDLMALLGEYAMVQGVQVDRVVRDRLYLNLEAEGSPAQLLEGLARFDRLEAVAGSERAGGGSARLRWRAGR